MTYLYGLSRKSEVIDKFRKFLAQVGVPKIIRTDNGGEFIGNDWNQVLETNKIKIERSCPYNQYQNGVAERNWRTVLSKIRALLIDSKLPKTYWPYAAQTAAYLMNRSPTRANKKFMTPYEKMTGLKPDISNIRIFGSLCYAHRNKEVRKDKKLDETATRGIFIGYPNHMKGYIVYLPSEKRYMITPNVTFNEEARGSQLLNKQLNESDEIIEVRRRIYTTEADIEPATTSERIDEPEERRDSQEPSEEIVEVIPTTQQDTEIESTNNRPTRIRRKPGEFWLANKDIERREESRLTQVKERTYWDVTTAEDKEEWIKAIDREVTNLKKNDTFDIVDIPSETNLVGWKWVFATRDSTGNKPAYKARLVAQGFSQKYGIDFFETYSPVANLKSVFTTVTIGTAHDYKLFENLIVRFMF